MVDVTEQFNANVLRYFEGPDPRGIGVISMLRHTDIREYSDFWVYNYEDSTGGRNDGTPRGALTGVGLDIGREKTVSIYSRPDSEVLFRTVALNAGGMLKKRFEYPLSDEQTEAALELSVNPLLFDHMSVFDGISGDDQRVLSESKKAAAESSKELQEALKDIRDAQKRAMVSAMTTFIG